MISYTSELKCELIKVCAEDLDVVNAARVSFDTQHEAMEEGDDKLINYLMKNKHGTPFEHAFFKFRVEAPIFVFREWHRHRVGHSYNEMSGRYTKLRAQFYLPDRARVQRGKPGHYTYDEPGLNIDRLVREELKASYASSWGHYQYLLDAGVAKEQARLCLPVAIYSTQVWSCNPRSLMHFLTLRTASNAMKEIRDLAGKVEAVFADAMPITYAAWHVNGRVAP
jgi:thymidylate synthase (FAD)